MNLLDVLYYLKKCGYLINFNLIMGGLFLCNCNGKSYVNGGQWWEPKAHLKRDVANRAMEGSVVAMLNIRKDFNPSMWMFLFLHPEYMEKHPVDYLYFSISLWVEGSRFG
jgi:hypothetical protein